MGVGQTGGSWEGALGFSGGQLGSLTSQPGVLRDTTGLETSENSAVSRYLHGSFSLAQDESRRAQKEITTQGTFSFRKPVAHAETQHFRDSSMCGEETVSARGVWPAPRPAGLCAHWTISHSSPVLGPLPGSWHQLPGTSQLPLSRAWSLGFRDRDLQLVPSKQSCFSRGRRGLPMSAEAGRYCPCLTGPEESSIPSAGPVLI